MAAAAALQSGGWFPETDSLKANASVEPPTDSRVLLTAEPLVQTVRSSVSGGSGEPTT